ncbi:Glu/Leu/Phe/Val dehydrogenase dimerization domain-containing protein [Longispora albida]|uniref:Glu/Leu/Phe/Val dehydrogenase dimerization domain-containing protein n=1 Tax=Longispora albida TaxID=203523 RepID=UPI00036D9F67|nr:Glu/Leu/Phe/Val dehydrogenase dimerization domain-containing protein [Longispora albida]
MTKILEYVDPADGLRGWLAYDATDSQLAAGGCRAQAGLTGGELSVLASRMTLKQRILGLNVDGAKCGIDYNPRSAGRSGALGRFLTFLRDELRDRFSMGPDMGTEWQELQQLAAAAGVPSTKYAIRKAQGLTDEEFFNRMARLRDQVGLMTLSQRRAGHAVGHAVIGAARAAEVTGQVTAAMQGFGNLGRAAACTLLEEGVKLVAVADEYGCVVDPAGLDIAGMLSSPPGMPVPQLNTPGVRMRSNAVFEMPADVLVLAAVKDAMSAAHTAGPPFAAVVVGANCGLSEDAEDALHTRGVFVVPDFIGGIGGSASMEALFAPRQAPSARQVLGNLAQMMRELVGEVAETSRRYSLPPREAALQLAASRTVDPAAPPYGQCPYLTTPTR